MALGKEPRRERRLPSGRAALSWNPAATVIAPSSRPTSIHRERRERGPSSAGVGPDEGLRIGLFDRLAQDGPVLDAALELAAEIAAKPAGAVQAVKALVDANLDSLTESGWRAEHEQVLAALKAQESPGSAVFSGFLDKRNPTE